MRTAHCSLQVALDFLAEHAKTKQLPFWLPVRRESIVPKVDHKGQAFATATAMCEFYKLDFTIVQQRLSVGWSLERSLTVPVQRKKSAYK